MATASKASRIRELLAAGKSTSQVAAIVGCSGAYVRVAGRQRASGRSIADLKYAEENPKYYARNLERWARHGKQWAKTPQGQKYQRNWNKARRHRLKENHIHA